jgi:hypothetical protein
MYLGQLGTQPASGFLEGAPQNPSDCIVIDVHNKQLVTQCHLLWIRKKSTYPHKLWTGEHLTPTTNTLFAWLINHQPAVLFSQNKSVGAEYGPDTNQ